MEKHLDMKSEPLWERYAIVPFFIAFASLFAVMGYGINKEQQKGRALLKQNQERQYQKINRDSR